MPEPETPGSNEPEEVQPEPEAEPKKRWKSSRFKRKPRERVPYQEFELPESLTMRPSPFVAPPSPYRSASLIHDSHYPLTATGRDLRSYREAVDYLHYSAALRGQLGASAQHAMQASNMGHRGSYGHSFDRFRGDPWPPGEPPPPPENKGPGTLYR